MQYPTIHKLIGAGFGALAFALALTLSACGSDSSSPTDPGTPAAASLQLSSAEVQANGEEYQVGSGGTFHHNHDGAQGGSTLFEATLTRDGAPVTGPEVEVHYETPMGHGGMMGGGAGSFHLYDDGTHGDPTPGDGVYHYEDHEGRYGFHHQGAGHGSYHYDFFGLHEDGSETNHMMIDIAVEH